MRLWLARLALLVFLFGLASETNEAFCEETAGADCCVCLCRAPSLAPNQSAALHKSPASWESSARPLFIVSARLSDKSLFHPPNLSA